MIISISNTCIILGCLMMLSNYFGNNNERMHNLSVRMIFFGAAFMFLTNIVSG
jgi:hypothetical protein